MRHEVALGGSAYPGFPPRGRMRHAAAISPAPGSRGNGGSPGTCRRMIAIARDLPVEPISLGHIAEFDENFWFRRPGDAADRARRSPTMPRSLPPPTSPSRSCCAPTGACSTACTGSAARGSTGWASYPPGASASCRRPITAALMPTRCSPARTGTRPKIASSNWRSARWFETGLVIRPFGRLRTGFRPPSPRTD